MERAFWKKVSFYWKFLRILLKNYFILRIQGLEKAVRERDEALRIERAKFGKLSDDFVFNLHLIEERDRELDSYETAFTGFSFIFWVFDGGVFTSLETCT